MKKKILLFVPILCIPLVLVTGVILFDNRQYAWVSLAVTVLACLPFFLRFERGSHSATELVLIAVMTALSVIGRILFGPVPAFKPVTALTIITAMYFGSEAGFMTGALTAVISNFAFGQGPWTPFQMLSWGLIGFAAGLMKKPLKKSRVLLCVYGAVAGIVYSLVMDVFTVLWMDNTINLARYAAVLVTALPMMLTYAVSNVVFLLLLAKPVGAKLQRVIDKYGIYDNRV